VLFSLAPSRQHFSRVIYLPFTFSNTLLWNVVRVEILFSSETLARVQSSNSHKWKLDKLKLAFVKLLPLNTTLISEQSINVVSCRLHSLKEELAILLENIQPSKLALLAVILVNLLELNLTLIMVALLKEQSVKSQSFINFDNMALSKLDLTKLVPIRLALVRIELEKLEQLKLQLLRFALLKSQLEK
jgi:hypothetical protein